MQKRSGFDNTLAELNGTYIAVVGDQAGITGAKAFTGDVSVAHMFGGAYSGQTGGGNSNEARVPFGTLFVVDAAAAGVNDFVPHLFQSVFTGNWAAAGSGTAPDVGFGFGANIFTVTGTASGDGAGGTFFGQLSEFDIRSDATIKAAYGLSGEASFLGASATGHAYKLQSLTAVAPKNKGGATTGTADFVFASYVNAVHSGNQTVLNGAQALNTGTIAVVSNRDFPATGTLKIGDPANGIAVQTIAYTGKTTSPATFTGCTGGSATVIGTGTPVGDGLGDLSSLYAWSQYVAGGRSFFGGQVTIQGEFGYDASRPVLLVRAVASHSGDVVAVRSATTDGPLFHLTATGVGAFTHDLYAHEGGGVAQIIAGTVGPSSEAGVTLGADTNLYRSAADTLKTDDTLIVGAPGTAAGSAATIDGTQTLTNKTISGGSNTLSNIAESAVTNLVTDLAAKAVKTDPLGLGVVYSTDPRMAASPIAWTGANRGIYTRVLMGGTISKLATDIGVSSGNISVAVYRNNGSAGQAAAPTGAPAITSGAIASPGTGYRELSLGGSITVNPGDWLFLSCDNTTFTVLRTTPGSATQILNGFAYRQDTAHPAPTVGTLTVTGLVPVLIGVP